MKLPRPFIALIGAAMLRPSPCSLRRSDGGSSNAGGADDPKAGWPKTFRVGLFGGDDAEAAIQTTAGPLKKSSRQARHPGRDHHRHQLRRRHRSDARQQDRRHDGRAVRLRARRCRRRSAEASRRRSAPRQGAEVLRHDSGLTTSASSRQEGHRHRHARRTSGARASPSSTRPRPRAIWSRRAACSRTASTLTRTCRRCSPAATRLRCVALWNGKTPAGRHIRGRPVQPRRHPARSSGAAYPDGKVGKDRTEGRAQELYDACPDGSIVIMAQYSDPIPNTPFAVRQDLPATFKSAVKDALLSMKDDPEFIKSRKALVRSTRRRSWAAEPRRLLQPAARHRQAARPRPEATGGAIAMTNDFKTERETRLEAISLAAA